MPTTQPFFDRWKGNRRVYIETGAEYGRSIELARHMEFDHIYSIELHVPYYEHCVKMFSGDKRVKMIQGDSGDELPRLLPSITEPALFWLDAHIGPAKNGRLCPLREEIEAIVAHPVKGHVLLIDDVREFKAMGVSVDHLTALLPPGTPASLETGNPDVPAWHNDILVIQL